MHIAILRRVPKFSVSMDVYADGLIAGLKVVRPNWTVSELHPAVSNVSIPKSLNGIQKYYERYWSYPSRLRRTKADIFHIIDHSDGYLSGWLRQDQKPNVVTCHDLINLIQPETFKGRAKFSLLSMKLWKASVEAMRQSNHIITVSAHTKEDTVKYLDVTPEKITVIPNAVDSRFKPLSTNRIQVLRQRYNLPTGTLCLLNVGSNNARKNILAILAAVDRLRCREVPVHFWKAGADFTQEQNQFIKTHNLEKYVAYLGKPSSAELIEIYNAADCLVAPSLYEGFGFTILEAMACAMPVVTANITAMPEVAGDAGLLVDPTDVDAIVDAIRYIYEHPDQAAVLSRKGVERASKFTWQNTAEQVAQVYERVLGNETLSA